MKETPNDGPTGYEPDFVFGGKRVISEESWHDYEAQGVKNVTEVVPADDEKSLREELERRGRDYGAENLLLGDAFDVSTGRPLRHKPGIGVYTTAEGVERYSGHAHPTVLKLPDGQRIVARPGQRIRFTPPDASPSTDTNSGKP